jgi:DNA-binding response OmpR family regulator
MSVRPVKLLHVEDNQTQHVLLAGLLRALSEFDFAITRETTEEAAVAEFRRGGYEFVLLDYQLEEGDGLSCLRRLRAVDPLVPIVAVSGMATAEVAADLLHSGADDYVNKLELTFDGFARSVREALARTAAFRRRLGTPGPAAAGPAAELFRQLCQDFASALGPNFTARLDAFEAAALAAGLTEEQLRRAFEEVCASWPAHGRPRRALRPLLLELFLRLEGTDRQPARG